MTVRRATVRSLLATTAIAMIIVGAISIASTPLFLAIVTWVQVSGGVRHFMDVQAFFPTSMAVRPCSRAKPRAELHARRRVPRGGPSVAAEESSAIIELPCIRAHVASAAATGEAGPNFRAAVQGTH